MPRSNRVGPRWVVWSLLALAWASGHAPLALAQDAGAKNQAATAQFNVAAELQNFGSYDKAAAKWEQFVKKYPQDKRLDRAHYYLGICRLHTKQYPQAVASFQTVLQKYPKFKNVDGAQFNLGMAYYQQATASKKPDDFKPAAKAFGDLATRFPKSKHAAKALYFQGESFYSSGNPQASLAAYKKLTEQHAGSSLAADAYYAWGTTQLELGQNAEAAATFKKFLANATLAKHELAGEIRLRLGMALFEEKQYAAAEKEFATVGKIDKFPLADFALLRQGQCRLETGKVDLAAQLFAAVLQRFPNSKYKAAARLAAGRCYFQSDKADDARKMLQPLADGNEPEAAEAAYWLGRTLLKTNKPQEALGVLDKAAKKHTQGRFAPYLQLARVDALYEIPERRKETPPLYEAFVKQFPTHPLAAQATYMTALAALGAKDFGKARQHADAFRGNTAFGDHKLLPAVLYIAAEGYLLAAEAKQPGGDVAKAEQIYRELVSKFPRHQRAPQAHLRIAWCLFQAGKHNEARNQLAVNLSKFKDPPQRAEAQLLIGRSHAAAGQNKEAVAAYDAAIKAHPQWARADEVLLAAAQSLRAAGDAQGAAVRLLRLYSGFAASAFRSSAIYQLGEIAQQQKKFDDAISRYKEVIQKHAQSEFAAAARYGLGASYYAKGDYKSAVEPLGQLLSSQADKDTKARGQYLRGLAYQRLTQLENAIKDFQAFLATSPAGTQALDARYALALCYIGRKQFGEAATSLDALLKAGPNYAHVDKVYYELGHALLEQKKPQEAIAAFRTLSDKRPDSPLVAECWFHVGRFHEDAAAGIGDADQKLAEIDKAAQAYASGVAKAKDNALKEKLQYKLGDMQFRQEKYDQAAATLLAQIKQHPGGAYVGPGRILAGESLFRQGAFDKALPLLVGASNDKFEGVAKPQADKYRAQALYRAGKCTANLNQWPESQRHYTELISKFGGFEQIADARYGVAWAMYKQNKLADARGACQQLVKDLSETPSEPVAQAYFLLGEIAFAEKKFEDASEHFLLVAVGYPYKELQALARFETGRCFMSLGQKENAVKSFQIVVDKFKDHPKAKDSARLIAELQK